MELIILLILIINIVSRVKKTQQTNGEARTQNDYTKQMKKGINNLDITLTNMNKKTNGKLYSEKKEGKKTVMEVERKQKEREARKVREFEERKKRELEEKKKQLEQKKRQEEKARKAKAEKEMLERFHVTEQSKQSCTVCNEETDASKGANEQFCIEHYLDPLTAPFYPGNKKKEKSSSFNVDDYLFPALAPYYPNTEDITVNTYK